MKKTTLGWIVAAILIAALAAAGLDGHRADTRQPAPGGAQAPLPERPPASPAETPPAADNQPRTGRMELPPAAKQAPPAAAAEFSYSLKKENKEKTILPGVTLSSEGQGVNIQLANKNETIQLRRNTTDPACDYKVMWQKKF